MCDFNNQFIDIVIMNRKKFFQVMLLSCLTLMAFTFTACDDDDDSNASGTYQYSLGFFAWSGNLTEMAAVENLYLSALGVTTTTFTLEGTRTECDNQIKTKCASVESSLSSVCTVSSWTIIVTCTNSIESSTVYTYSFTGSSASSN